MFEMLNRKRGWIALAAVVLALASVGLALRGRGTSLASAGASGGGNGTPAAIVAAPGRVEPVSEDVKLGSEISGKLDQVLVDEGDHVRKGQLLAVLVNDDYRAQVAVEQANLTEKQADERKTRNGARAEERGEAQAAAAAQEAILEESRANMERYQKLYQGGATSHEDADRYLREYKVAKAEFDRATQHSLFVSEDAREEDQARETADVALAAAQLDQARALYNKTFLRAPIDGKILRRYHRAGESVNNSSNPSDPIFAIGSNGVLRVRADVDETDIARVRVGDRAYVTADAFGGAKFWGQVVRLGGELGRKNVRTDEPSERVDTKILETLVKLDDGHELPIGLRVDTFILPNP
jgi:HlyD family secretion protein